MFSWRGLAVCRVNLATLKKSFTSYQLYKNKKSNFSRTPALQQRSQVKGTVTKVVTMSPKKPNSASRHVAKIKLTNTINVTARVPGSGYICSKYNRVLVHGGRANDLPGVGYTLVRGAYDFSPVISKKKRRSIYGVSRPANYTKHIKRSLRTV